MAKPTYFSRTPYFVIYSVLVCIAFLSIFILAQSFFNLTSRTLPMEPSLLSKKSSAFQLILGFEKNGHYNPVESIPSFTISLKNSSKIDQNYFLSQGYPPSSANLILKNIEGIIIEPTYISGNVVSQSIISSTLKPGEQQLVQTVPIEKDSTTPGSFKLPAYHIGWRTLTDYNALPAGSYTAQISWRDSTGITIFSNIVTCVLPAT